MKRCTKPSFGGLGAGVGGGNVYGWEEGRMGARVARAVFGSGGRRLGCGRAIWSS